MSQDQKSTIILGQYKTQDISIAASGSSITDDANEISENTKEIGVFDISITTVPEGVSILNPDTKDDMGMITLDGIFCPYTTATSHDNLPSWTVPTATDASDINQYKLNPFNFKNLSLDDPQDPDSAVNPQNFFDSGHNIQLYNSITDISLTSIEDLSAHKALGQTRSPQVKGVRGVGLRAPIVLTGPGYDTNGKPVPADQYDENSFHADAFSDPSLWKSGPLDIRWNEAKGVWAAGAGGGSTVYECFFEITAGSYCGSCYVIGLVSSYAPTDIGISDLPRIGEGFTSGMGLDLDDSEVGEDRLVIWDRAGCFFGEPIEDLLGRKGFAKYMTNIGTGPCAEIGDPENNPVWVVTSLCCNDEGC